VELFIDSSLNIFAVLDEVLNVFRVFNIDVKVILEVLEGVHHILHNFVPSDTWEREGLIVELPGVNLRKFWSMKFALDLPGVSIMLIIECS
jgi:hypothetical protein